jgi:hypothetical protein
MNKEPKKITLNEDQNNALSMIKDFIRSPYSKVFILKGFAGTGKTTMIKQVIEFMNKHEIGFELLASTGRAAKVLEDTTGTPAKTIHSEIYSFQGFNEDSYTVSNDGEPKFKDGQQLVIQFDLKSLDELAPTLYIIDESSMISDQEEKFAVQSKYGNGKLLTDLFKYNPKAKYIFIGDPCQLPPVSGEPAPALSATYIREHFKYDVKETALTKVMRQADDNGIVEASTKIRNLWAEAPDTDTAYYKKTWGRLPFRNVHDLNLVSSPAELSAGYLNDIKSNGYTNAVFICKSNTGCHKFSSDFRKSLGFEGPLKKGELLLVIQNNLISGLRNGDLVVIENVSPVTRTLAGLTFREIEVRELYTDRICQQLMIEDLLHKPQLNLDTEQQSQLFIDFIKRMHKCGINEKKHPVQFSEKMRTDIYLNALRVTFGYALTCHKAQGGEWDNVYAYFPRNIMLNPTKQQYQWIYTALTRAKNQFFVPDDIYIENYGSNYQHFWSFIHQR